MILRLQISPLYHAIINHSWKIAELLLELGCSINAKDRNDLAVTDFAGRTPLHHAIINHSWKIAELLLELGCPINAKDHNDLAVTDFGGRTLLHHAIINNSWRIAKLLLELGCSINAKDNNLQTPLHIAVKKEGCYELITLLGYYGCDFNSQDNRQNTPLHLAIIYQSAANIKTLLQASKFNINKKLQNCEGNTAKRVLRNIENPQVHNTLDKAFNILPNSLGRSPFHVAVIKNNKDLVSLLLDLGADINEPDYLGMTALHLAAKCGHALLLVFLTYHPQIRMDQQDINGNTALHHSVMAGEEDCIKKLVSAQKPADKNIKNKDKYTAADLIRKWKGDPDRVSALKKALLSIPITNARSPEYELKVIDYETTETNYLGYLRKHFKGLEISIKKKADRRSASMSPNSKFNKERQRAEKTSLTSPQDKIKFGRDIIINEPKFLKSAYKKNNSQAIADFITMAQISNDPSLLQKLKEFVNYYNDEKAPLLVLKAFEYLQSSLAREQKKIADRVSTFPQKLIDEGFITVCTMEEVNHLTMEDLNKIDVEINVTDAKISDFDKASMDDSHQIDVEINVTDTKISDFSKASMDDPNQIDVKINVTDPKMSDFDKGSMEDLNQIDVKMSSSDKIYMLTLAKICSGKASVKSPNASKAKDPNERVDCIINLKSVENQVLGLIERIEPQVIISFLIKLNPKFSKIQQLQSHFIVFTLIGLWEFYGYEELNGSVFIKKVDSYILSCCTKMPAIAASIREYKKYVLAFKNNSLNAIVQEMRPFLLKAIKPQILPF